MNDEKDQTSSGNPTLLAIQGSIGKHQRIKDRILAGEEPAFDSESCSLCDEFASYVPEGCGECPLNEQGLQCDEEGSPYRELMMNSTADNSEIMISTLKNCERAELEKAKRAGG